MNIVDLFFWLMMVLSGYYLVGFTIAAVKDLFKADLLGMFILLVCCVILWNIHKWAFIKLAPLQTLF